jgi:DNA-binding MarR family transcriptional regulator
VAGQDLWLTAPEQKAWRALVGATGALMATLDGELQSAHRMSLAEYEVLVALSESAERRLRMTDLATTLHLSPSGLTRRLDVLARRGWVTRERCPSDRRGTFAVLTDEGFAQLEIAAPTHVRGVREHLIDRLSPRQLSNLAGALGPIASEWPLHGTNPCEEREAERDDERGANGSTGATGAGGRAPVRR